jgi:cytochrome P450
MPIFQVSSLDPFADDFLAAPYPFYAELRDAGPVVWLERYGLWACARHAEVQAALTDWQTFSSAAGVPRVNLNRVFGSDNYFLKSPGTLPPFSASLIITCLCNQMFIAAESLVPPG